MNGKTFLYGQDLEVALSSCFTRACREEIKSTLRCHYLGIRGALSQSQDIHVYIRMYRSRAVGVFEWVILAYLGVADPPKSPLRKRAIHSPTVASPRCLMTMGRVN